MVGRIWVAAAVLFGLSGCASVSFDRLDPGVMTGSVIVMWLGEGGPSGDGSFLFVPDPADPLIFKRPRGAGPAPVIKPAMMYTDGGSIPRLAQVFNGLHPWGYAPAYMIHDWVFTAHHCVVDNDPDPIYAPIRDVAFDDSAKILGEAIKTLIAQNQVKDNDLAGTAITGAVDTILARNLWEKRGSCAETKVSARDRLAAQRALSGASTARSPRDFRELDARLPSPQAGSARIVARVKL